MQKIKRNIACSVAKIITFVAALIIGTIITLHFSLAEEVAQSNSSFSIPELPFSFSVKWDISKEDNQLLQDFVVNERDPFSWFYLLNAPSRLFRAKAHSYQASITFQSTNNQPFGSKEWERLIAFVGDGALDAHTHKPMPAGVTIPVNIKLEKIDGIHIQTIMPENEVDTTNASAFSAVRLSIDRLIENVGTLSAGKYRISVKVPHAIKMPPNVETVLMVGTRID